jgi:hypothetical protein
MSESIETSGYRRFKVSLVIQDVDSPNSEVEYHFETKTNVEDYRGKLITGLQDASEKIK